MLYQAKGDYARAEPLYRRALAIAKKALGPQHPAVATTLNNLAELYYGKGDYARAEPLHRRALAIAKQALGLHHPHVATDLSSLAALHWAQGDTSQTIKLMSRANAIREHHLGILIATGSEEQKRAYMATLIGETDATLSLHLQAAPDNPQAARLALTMLLQRKGRVLDAMAESMRSLRQGLNLRDQALLDRLAAVNSQLGPLYFQGPGELTFKQYQTQVARLERQRQALEGKISARVCQHRTLPAVRPF